jgi:uncharacterized alkaline shock family protein YloU
VLQHWEVEYQRGENVNVKTENGKKVDFRWKINYGKIIFKTTDLIRI